jgi:shikimate kinase
MDCLRELGTSIYIRWSPEHLAKRLSLTDLNDRPVLQGRTEKELLAFIAPQLAAREPFYARANHILDVDICDEQSDERIAEELFTFISQCV